MTDGYIAVRIIPGSFNADEFQDYIVEQVVSTSHHVINHWLIAY